MNSSSFEAFVTEELAKLRSNIISEYRRVEGQVSFQKRSSLDGQVLFESEGGTSIIEMQPPARAASGLDSSRPAFRTMSTFEVQPGNRKRDSYRQQVAELNDQSAKRGSVGSVPEQTTRRSFSGSNVIIGDPTPARRSFNGDLQAGLNIRLPGEQEANYDSSPAGSRTASPEPVSRLNSFQDSMASPERREEQKLFKALLNVMPQQGVQLSVPGCSGQQPGEGSANMTSFARSPRKSQSLPGGSCGVSLEQLKKVRDDHDQTQAEQLGQEPVSTTVRFDEGIAATQMLGQVGQPGAQAMGATMSNASAYEAPKSSKSRTKIISTHILLEGTLTSHVAWRDQDSDSSLICEKLKVFDAGHLPGKEHGRRRSSLKDLQVWGLTQSQQRPNKSMFSWLPSAKKSFQCRTLIVDPSNPRRIAWDSLGILMIGYDCIFIPLTIFELPSNFFFATMQWLSLVFWSTDIFASFCVGYHHRGLLEMRPRQICKQYLKTFFFVDVMLVAIDLMVIFLDVEGSSQKSSGSADPSGIARAAKSYRMMRILRGLRLIRLVKLPKTFSALLENIQSDWIVVALGIAKLTVAIIMTNHVIACIWFAICSWGASSASWVASDDLPDGSIAYLYMTSLHWSLTQFTPAAMEVYPAALHERTFAVCVIIFALVTFSSFISSITNAMNDLHALHAENAKHLAVLQKYFRNNGISLSLCVRIRRHIDYKIGNRAQSIQEKDVQLLEMLSVPLKVDLHYEVNSALLKTHAFFAQFDTAFQRCMKRTSHECVQLVQFSEGDLIFCRADFAKHFYIVKSGTLIYTDYKDVDHRAKAGECIAEAALWTHWLHHGTAHAHNEMTLVSLDIKKFLICALESRANMGGAADYAAIFVEHLNMLEREELSDLTDHSFNCQWATQVAFLQLGVPDSIKEDDIEEEEDDDNSDTSSESIVPISAAPQAVSTGNLHAPKEKSKKTFLGSFRSSPSDHTRNSAGAPPAK